MDCIWRTSALCTFLPRCFGSAARPCTHWCFCASSNFSCGSQCSEAALQKGCAGHPNEGSLTYFLALLFFPGVGARVMVRLLGRRLSVVLLPCWNTFCLVCSQITFLSKQGDGSSYRCCCPAAET